jgi:hypothetical protein
MANPGLIANDDRLSPHLREWNMDDLPGGNRDAKVIH